MLMAPITPPRRHDYLVVRLLRRWAVEREHGGDQLPSLVKLGRRLGIDAQAAVAVASMFQLAEHCLGRPLQAECCCSPRLSRDEQAMLLLLHQPVAAASIPHGLPGGAAMGCRMRPPDASSGQSGDQARSRGSVPVPGGQS